MSRSNAPTGRVWTHTGDGMYMCSGACADAYEAESVFDQSDDYGWSPVDQDSMCDEDVPCDVCGTVIKGVSK